MQVGTSCASAITRGIDYTFTCPERAECVVLEFLRLPFFLARDRAGVLWSVSDCSIQGSHSLSRYGDHIAVILPSVLPATPARRREGFTDLSRLMSAIARTPGSFVYPTRNFATLGPFVSVTSRTLEGADISAALFASPRRPDYIITIRSDRVWRVVSEDSRTLLEPLRPHNDDFRHRSCPRGSAESL